MLKPFDHLGPKAPPLPSNSEELMAAKLQATEARRARRAARKAGRIVDEPPTEETAAETADAEPAASDPADAIPEFLKRERVEP